MARRRGAPDVTTIPLGRPSPGASSDQPERSGPRTGPEAPRRPASLLFGLAPGGACRAADVAADAVRSCRTLSPLPTSSRMPRIRLMAGGLLSVALSLGSPPPDVIRRRVRMEPGLSSARRRRPSGRLAGQGHRLAERRGSRALTNPPRRERRRKIHSGFTKPVPPWRDVVGGAGAFESRSRRASGRSVTTTFACGFHATQRRRVR